MRPFSQWCREIASPTLDRAPSLLPAFAACASVRAAEFTDDVERDFKLRSIGHLQISNLRGPIVIQGWTLDKIRVKARRKVIAGTRRGGQAVSSTALDFRYRERRRRHRAFRRIRHAASEIQERLRERENPRTSMEMVDHRARPNLKMRVWAVDGAVQREGLERAARGPHRQRARSASTA